MDSGGHTNCNHWTTLRTAGCRSSSPNPTCCRCWSSVDSGGKPRDGDWRIMMEGRNDWRAPDFAVVSLSFQEGGRTPVVKLLCCWETPPGTSSAGAKVGVGRRIPPPSDLTCQPHSCHARCNLRHLLQCSEVEEPRKNHRRELKAVFEAECGSRRCGPMPRLSKSLS